MGRRIATSLALAGALLCASAGGAWAHGSAAQEHFEIDYVVHEPGEERELGRESRLATRADAAAAAVAAAGDPDDVGEWGPLMNWPLVGVHVALMPNGEVLAYDSVGDSRTEAYPNEQQVRTRALLWDPQDSSISRTDAETGINIFCSGLAHLVDGSLFVAGGNKDVTLAGSAATNVFDSESDTWLRTDDMAYERWYPSTTPLANGEILITGGSAAQGEAIAIPEVRGLDGAIRALDDAAFDLERDPIYFYPWMDAGPDGQVFYTGPGALIQSLDPSGEGEWKNLGFRDFEYRDYGSRAMYDVGKILVSGGGSPPSSTSETIDLTEEEPDDMAESTGGMATPRRQHNLTVLADGSVLATGGLSSNAGQVDVLNGVYTAELWDPDTGEWRTLAAEERTRQYHSTALLLPDGRVLSSGGGICGACEENSEPDYLEKNGQVFSPPYLFDDDGSPAARPTITDAPDSVGFDRTFDIATPDPATIAEVSMVRLGAVTHSVNMEQRYVPLDFEATGTGLTATSPPDGDAAPPGYYMLFLIDDEGVPSVSRMVRIDLPDEPPPPPGEPPNRPDLVAPDTRIDRGPKGKTNKRRVTFRFSSDDPGASFECSLDGKRFRACTSPLRARLGKGKHSFAVRAVDAAGNADPRAARMRFKITPKQGGPR